MEVYALLWRPGWRLAPTVEYDCAHTEAIRQGIWLVEAFGRLESIPGRLHRATEIILIDVPLEMHPASDPSDTQSGRLERSEFHQPR